MASLAWIDIYMMSNRTNVLFTKIENAMVYNEIFCFCHIVYKILKIRYCWGESGRFLRNFRYKTRMIPIAQSPKQLLWYARVALFLVSALISSSTKAASLGLVATQQALLGDLIQTSGQEVCTVCLSALVKKSGQSVHSKSILGAVAHLQNPPVEEQPRNQSMDEEMANVFGLGDSDDEPPAAGAAASAAGAAEGSEPATQPA